MVIIIVICVIIIVMGVSVIYACVTADRTEKLILKMGYTQDEIETIDMFCEMLGRDYREFPTSNYLQSEYQTFRLWKRLNTEWTKNEHNR